MIGLESEYDLSIYGWRWTLKFVPRGTPGLEQNIGLTCWTNNTIYIDDTLEVEAARVTIFHEISHVIFGHCGLNSVKTDEMAADLIGTAIPKCLETMDIKLLSFLLGRGLEPKRVRTKK